ncbi:Hypothetical protein ORPV_280 [Orpheovirus IHUMI-LCC2]|uniref:Uncharacterized protein n=1 Tax=Orpheovirus IHUMI-LCC2 TaxID=2023057 RepID=A0A2I2L3S6_9VIRU|nr:Hypothetical protein ORPV_280 [Orpheovirus IHUMI-LCC2]SNW62184.1 Hypothetical protein ORPV_280 [Orpheovirus IHUMI-LCC2]
METTGQELKNIYDCKSVDDVISYSDKTTKEIEEDDYGVLVPDGNIEVDISNRHRHIVSIYQSCGMEYVEYYAAFSVCDGYKPKFLDCWRLGTFDGEPYKYNKEEKTLLLTNIYTAYLEHPEYFQGSKDGKVYYLKPVDNMYANV